MTETDAPVTEADLHAYLDGELGPERRRAIEAHLASHPEEAARLESYRRHDLLIRRSFRPLAERPLPARLTRPLAYPARPWRRWTRALAAAAAGLTLFALGAASGWYGRSLTETPTSAPRPFVADAFDAHLVYAVEVRHPVEVSAEERDHLGTWLSRRLGVPVRIPDLSARGFELVGGRLLPAAGGQPAAQLMYQDLDGRRVTVYLRHEPDARETAFRFSHEGPLAAFYWQDRGVGLAILGELSRRDLLNLAHLVYAQLAPA